MNCKYCGAELEESARFCRFCGRKQDSDAAGKNGSKGKSKAKYIIIPIAITAGVLSTFIVIAVIAVIAIFMLNGNSGEKVEFGDDLIALDTTEYDFYEEDPYDNYYDDDREEYEPETEPEPEDTFVEEETTSEPETQAPETDYDDNLRVAIAHGGLRIRNKPDLTYGAIVGLIPNGTLLSIEKIENNWAYIYYEGVYGWCSCDFLFAPYEYSGDPIYIATANHYNGIDLTTDKHGTEPGFYTIIPNGETVYVYEIEGNRAFVKFNNIYGWCSTEYLTLREL